MLKNGGRSEKLQKEIKEFIKQNIRTAKNPPKVMPSNGLPIGAAVNKQNHNRITITIITIEENIAKPL